MFTYLLTFVVSPPQDFFVDSAQNQTPVTWSGGRRALHVTVTHPCVGFRERVLVTDLACPWTCIHVCIYRSIVCPSLCLLPRPRVMLPKYSISMQWWIISVQFSSVQNGSYATGRAKICSTPSLRSLPNVNFETVSISV